MVLLQDGITASLIKVYLSPRFQYEEELRRSPLNYDNWFDYVKLEESTGDVDRVREVSS